ncbi:hypothetical protein PoB_005696800 [Plakobranchus ocellatus]|uniref:RNase H type-1 domain-containing protein n=1 Tax=Plakobranchus ocellatus TaxID=259542 RepID=A0AAV4CHD7_9GAST|nr:hypothetical protein PoB_005696800 [Plakobranchus ocellatus]
MTVLDKPVAIELARTGYIFRDTSEITNSLPQVSMDKKNKGLCDCVIQKITRGFGVERNRALGGSGSEGVGGAVLLTDYLQKTEGARTMVQWLSSHDGALGNEIADGLANEGRTQPQPRKLLTLSGVRSVLRRGTAKPWSAAQLSNDERLPHFYEA